MCVCVCACVCVCVCACVCLFLSLCVNFKSFGQILIKFKHNKVKWLVKFVQK